MRAFLRDASDYFLAALVVVLAVVLLISGVLVPVFLCCMFGWWGLFGIFYMVAVLAIVLAAVDRLDAA